LWRKWKAQKPPPKEFVELFLNKPCWTIRKDGVQEKSKKPSVEEE
jgi:hypothetical protein